VPPDNPLHHLGITPLFQAPEPAESGRLPPKRLATPRRRCDRQLVNQALDRKPGGHCIRALAGKAPYATRRSEPTPSLSYPLGLPRRCGLLLIHILWEPSSLRSFPQL
jgi:hypothetical protein